MERKGTNILEGEASESDEETLDYPGFVQNTMVTETKSDGPSSSVVVSGEASESDDDNGDFILRRDFMSLQNEGNHELEVQDEYSIKIQTTQPRFESPFHKKIWERNFAFRLGVVQIELEKYDHIINRLGNFIAPANRSQTHAQEALKHYRKIAETTKELTDNLENMLHTTDLPDLNESIPLD